MYNNNNKIVLFSVVWEMEKESSQVTNRLDSIIERKDGDALEQILEEFLNQPMLLKDVIEYIKNRQSDSKWLVEMGDSMTNAIWAQCYLKKFPMEIPAIYEFYYFSQKAVGTNQYETYGTIDLTLSLNFSNIKGFPLPVSFNPVCKFFEKNKGTIRNQLYPRIASSGERDQYSLLNPNHNEWSVWRMFHIKMRQIAFQFLHWLSETIPKEMRAILVRYGIYLLGKKWETYPIKHDPQQEEKIQFFLSPGKTDLFEDNPELKLEAEEKLREIIEAIDITHGANDMDLFALSYDEREMRRWMNAFSPTMAENFRERCCSFTSQ